MLLTGLVTGISGIAFFLYGMNSKQSDTAQPGRNTDRERFCQNPIDRYLLIQRLRTSVIRWTSRYSWSGADSNRTVSLNMGEFGGPCGDRTHDPRIIWQSGSGTSRL